MTRACRPKLAAGTPTGRAQQSGAAETDPKTRSAANRDRHRNAGPVSPSTARANHLQEAADTTSFYLERPSDRNRHLGRSSGFRIDLLATPSRERVRRKSSPSSCSQWLLCSVRPRLQRRDRNGLAPFSLFFPRSDRLRKTPTSSHIVSPGHMLSTAGKENRWRTCCAGCATCDRTEIAEGDRVESRAARVALLPTVERHVSPGGQPAAGFTPQLGPTACIGQF